MGYPCISWNGDFSAKIATAFINTEISCARREIAPSFASVTIPKHRNLRQHNIKNSRKSRNRGRSSIVINSHLDEVSNFAGSILPELRSNFAALELQPGFASLQQSIQSLSSVVTQIAHQQGSLINQIAEAFQTFTNHIIHTVAADIVEPFHIAYLSSPTLSTASIFFTLATSAIALKSLDKEDNIQLSLSNLRSLKERLQQLQNTVSSAQPHTDDADVEKALPLQYDPEAINAYYKKRPLLVLHRAGFILLECSILLVNILIDNALGKTKQNESLRASQLVNLITRLGPMAVKVGQAMSIRPDLLPPAYLDELEKLQNCVPPFSSPEAKRIVADSLGATIEDIFSEFSANPIAAASVGQVYKAKLKETGETVAVKVQRPNVFGTACLDLFIIRALANGWQRLPNNKSSDFLSFIDHWADHFFQELNYTQEASNMEEFSKNMQSLPSLVVPKAIKKYTSRKVLTTTWIAGEKLSESKEADVTQLTSVALNCYLMQLLETGFLHADPHPGNLLRTKDGQLCVLDFGLMIQVTEEQRYALIDYISHLVNSDYEKVPDDLIKLGFVPHPVDEDLTTKILPELSRVLSRLVKGGGMKELDLEQIIADLARMASEYSIAIPPYFGMILRAFSILEGIGLKNNPNYVIMDECYPYICQRLLTDNSPRAQSALKYFLYGKEARLNARRVEGMLKGFQNFRKTMLPAQKINRAQLLDPMSKQMLDSIFAPEGSFLQELLLTEIVRVVDALSREAIFELWNTFVGIAFPFAHFRPPPFSIPIPGFFGMSRISSLSDEDQEALTLVRTLGRLLSPDFTNKQIAADMTAMTHAITALMPEFAGGAMAASTRFWFMLLHRKALRFADDLDGKNSLAYWNIDPAASARMVRPLGFLAPPRDISNGLKR